MPLNKELLRPKNLVSTKTLLLKHYYRRQGYLSTPVFTVEKRERICDRILRSYLKKGAATALANYGHGSTNHLEPPRSSVFPKASCRVRGAVPSLAEYWISRYGRLEQPSPCQSFLLYPTFPNKGRGKRIPVPVPPPSSKKAMQGEKLAGTNEFAFFRCRSTCAGGGGVQNQAENTFEKCLLAGTGTKIYFSRDVISIF